MHLLIGPSCVGKSTYFASGAFGDRQFGFARDLIRGGCPDDCVLHYNLLFPGPLRLNDDDDCDRRNNRLHSTLADLLDQNRVEAATVLVAPIDALSARAARRTVIEPGISSPNPYRQDLWHAVLAQTDLFALYEQLFDLLEAAGVDYEVLYSDPAEPPVASFLPSDRVFVHLNLRGRHVPPPDSDHIDRLAKQKGMEYQEVRLPGDRSTPVRQHKHVAGGRGQTFAAFADVDFRDRSVLDIGCA